MRLRAISFEYRITNSESPFTFRRSSKKKKKKRNVNSTLSLPIHSLFENQLLQNTPKYYSFKYQKNGKNTRTITIFNVAWIFRYRLSGRNETTNASRTVRKFVRFWLIIKKKFECTFSRGFVARRFRGFEVVVDWEKPNERKGAPEKMRRRDSTRDWSSRLWTSRGERRLIRREEALFPRLLVSPSLHESFPSSPCSSGRVQLTAQQKNTEISSVPPCLSSSFLRSVFFFLSFLSFYKIL